ncbi:hypothetical protein ASC66_15630 [Leifsonia sp. Root4]|uniref:hypothetical protein n=1 Tax=Leifsonia sp. Root4 TaxID=1736525 RepID=UPI000701A5B5|nr:hypothetical protein [Leifsonia sp. Root4]KQW05095.1 hypothetical protein ASC66_15630 [Leifsonia sp. Root4]
MTLSSSHPADAAPRAAHPKRTLRLLLAAAATAAAALLIPSGVTGAYWTTTAAGAAVTPGVGDWCATPDPAANPRIIRLSDIPETTGADGAAIRMAIIPVANNAAWGGDGTTARTLAVKLRTCSTTIPAFNLRITAWSNSTANTGATTFANGGAVAPSSRLSLTAGRGSEIQKLARWGQSTSSGGTTVSNLEARRFSWLVSGSRTSASPAAAPADCHNRACAPDFTAVAAPSAFVANNWTTTPSATYSAATFALNTPGGGSDWGSASGLNANGNPNSNSIVSATATTLVPSTSDATALASTDGNVMQWVVIQWSGTTPPSDLLAEIVLL